MQVEILVFSGPVMKHLSKEEAVFVLMDRTLKFFMTVGLIIVVGFGLLFLIAYVIDFIEKESKAETIKKDSCVFVKERKRKSCS